MQRLLVFLTTLVSLASNQDRSDIDCTQNFESVYKKNDLKSALQDINQFKKLEYVYQNHQHYYYSTITFSDLARLGLSLDRRSRIVLTFEFYTKDVDSGVKGYSCHIFTDSI